MMLPFAYIDPMSGTVILQVIIAAVVGAGAFFRHSIASILALLTGRKSKTAAETSTADQQASKAA